MNDRAANALKQLEGCGQSPWLDYLIRSLVAKGDLQTMIERDGLKGVTSNPSIFQKAIGESDEYAEEMKAFLGKADASVGDIYEHLAVADIQAAADVLKSVYDATGGRDGYVSLECSPYLAEETEGTFEEARRLWAAVGRPNLMVKIPATPQGVPAIQRVIAEGINVNVTLLFAIEAYEAVAEAYIAGLEALHEKGGDVSKVGSVASFFVSRIDAAVEKALEGKPGADAIGGKVAIANAKLAYARYKEIFSGPRWEALAAAGAKTQRLLWASTGVKSKTLKDTLYVEALVGRDTVDTIPPATMDAFRDHGEVQADAVEADLAGARTILDGLKAAGVSLDEITTELVKDGVRQFADAFDKLLGAVAAHRVEILGDPKPRQEIEPGGVRDAYEAELARWRTEGLIRRLWAGDRTLWTGKDEDRWIGWFHIVERELEGVDELERFAAKVKGGGFSDVVLLGMGGSSLGPEVLALSFGRQAGFPRFHMLDSTDPAQVAAIEAAVEIDSTLFITSSKSGGTLEPNIFTDYFLARTTEALGADRAAKRFVAVTDPGSSLERRAKEAGFLQIFYGEPSIGGRYSVLSRFGLVPAAAMGIDVRRLLETTRAMQRGCGPDTPPSANPGTQLGVLLGSAAKAGRDKVTIIASPGVGDLGAWLEQLLAESTGKEGHGLIPVAEEPLGPPGSYGSDRVFAYLELDGGADAAQRAAVDALAKAGHPVARITLKDVWSVGPEFFRWEIATAVAGAVIGINPFDQPDVEGSKNKTRDLTKAYEESRRLPDERPIFEGGGVALYADERNASALGRHDDLAGYLRAHFGRVSEGDYVTFLAYLERNEAHIQALQEARTAVRDRTKAATCLGFGPRFQHSTGQAYKGGPNSGVFLQVTSDHARDLDVPGHGYSFGVVEAFQARGDLDVLVERGRRALRVHLHDPDTGLRTLGRAIAAAVA